MKLVHFFFISLRNQFFKNRYQQKPKFLNILKIEIENKNPIRVQVPYATDENKIIVRKGYGFDFKAELETARLRFRHGRGQCQYHRTTLPRPRS